MTRYANSQAHQARAERVTPTGSQTLSKRPGAFPTAYPKYCTHGEGPYLIDVDGNRYLDWIGSLGATPLGYNHPKIVEAIERQLRQGGLFSLPHVKEAQVAEQLVDVIPCAEQIKFTKTGSEACAAAVRIARRATGRTRILVADNGYHGWHDWYAVTKHDHAGVPELLQRVVRTFKYNDLADLKHALDGDGAILGREDLTAAVILEPARLDTPAPGYLRGVIDLAHDYGALVIFDEMILGGRHALAGGQELYQVTPDLATFGKAFGAGLPLAFVAGRRTLMQEAWPVSGTYAGDVLALAACEAMLEVYHDEDVTYNLWRNGGALLGALAKHQHVTVRGLPQHFAISFPDNHRYAMSVFVQQCASRGVLFHPAVVNACAGMLDADLAWTRTVVDEVLQAMAHTALIGEPYADSVRT